MVTRQSSKSSESSSDDIASAMALEERARDRRQAVYPNFDVGWPTLILATIGAGFSIGVLSAFLFPLARISIKYWAG